jgi:hypothetical protein
MKDKVYLIKHYAKKGYPAMIILLTKIPGSYIIVVS